VRSPNRREFSNGYIAFRYTRQISSAPVDGRQRDEVSGRENFPAADFSVAVPRFDRRKFDGKIFRAGRSLVYNPAWSERISRPPDQTLTGQNLACR
jgi:hypothetical protein